MRVLNRNRTLKEIGWMRKKFLNLKNIPYHRYIWQYCIRPKKVRF